RSSVLATVDLPQPDSPTSPSVSPRCSSKLTPSTACTAPIWRLEMSPWVSGKCLTRPSTRSSGSVLDTEHLVVEVAGAGAAARQRVQPRVLGGARLLASERAAGVERAARRDRGQVRRRAADRLQ